MTRAEGASRRSVRDALLAVSVIALAVAVCVSLGLWQWHRFENKREAAATIRANYDAEPRPLPDVLPSPEAELGAQQDWAPVELTGRYCTDPGCVLYVRNRPLSGSVGFWQLVPFVTDQGTVLVVRGWVDTAETDSVPVEQPEIPEGEITVVAHLRPDEPVLKDRTDPPGQVQSVAAKEIAAQIPVDGPVYTGAYGDLVSESPTDIARPHPLEAPSTSLGPHLSYAFQWWVFALFFPAALVVRARRARQDRRAAAVAGASGVEAEGGTAARSGAPARPSSDARGTSGPKPLVPRRRPRTRSRDEEEEDALLDDHDR